MSRLAFVTACIVAWTLGALVQYRVDHQPAWTSGETISAEELSHIKNSFDISSPWKKAGVRMQTTFLADGGPGSLNVYCINREYRPWVLWDGERWQLVCDMGQTMGYQRWRTVPIPDSVLPGSLIGEVRGTDGAIWYSHLDGGEAALQ